MTSATIPKFSGPHAQQAARRWAEWEVKLRVMNALEQAASSMLVERDASPNVVPLAQLNAIENTVQQVRQRQKDKLAKISLLTSIEGITYTLGKRLINEFGTNEAIAKATLEQLQMVEGVNLELAAVLKRELPNLINSSN